uniref:DNA-directed DNA polymerase n=2 Tax=Tetranychus urticae TaxID=32264 RepID=A0A158P570_TETUR
MSYFNNLATQSSQSSDSSQSTQSSSSSASSLSSESSDSSQSTQSSSSSASSLSSQSSDSSQSTQSSSSSGSSLSSDTSDSSQSTQTANSSCSGCCSTCSNCSYGSLSDTTQDELIDAEIESHQRGGGSPDHTPVIASNEIAFEVIDEQPWRNNPVFHSMTKVLRARLNNGGTNGVDIARLSQAIDTAYENFVSALIRDAGENDRIYITFRNPQENRELYVSFLKKNFNPQEFLDRAYALAQSAGNFLDDGVMEIKIQIIKCISGGANRSVSRLMTANARVNVKRSILEIVNDDNLCGYLAIAVGKFNVDKKSSTEMNRWKRIRQSLPAQKKIAAELFNQLNFEVNGEMNINKIAEIQNILIDYQIVVVDQRTQLKLFAGPSKDKKIILEYSEPSHFNTITSLNGYMECNGFCIRCWVKINEEQHFCKGSCKNCNSLTPCQLASEITCEVCHVDFVSQHCYDAHIANNICAQKKKCEKCWIIYRLGDEHECDRYVCNICSVRYRHSPHYCFIKPANLEYFKEMDAQPSVLICYDIESMQVSPEPSTNSSNSLHKPNLLISATVCTSCLNAETLTKTNACDVCGVFENVWYGEHCIKAFCDYLYNEIIPKTKAKNMAVTVIAHNQRGYDGHFIMQDFFQRQFQLIPDVIMCGSKIMYTQMENLRFVDSLSLFMQPLASLCKSFNINELKKGYFPHKFNTPEHQSYVGPFPSKEFYEPQFMKPENKTAFENWYNHEASTVTEFDFKKEIIEYCRSDVQILLTAILKFVKLFSSITGLNPITRSFTLASVAMEVFRANMLPSFTLAITPVLGYANRMQSKVGNAWLDFMQKFHRNEIKREYRLGPYYADGFIPYTKQVFEFWGCYYHGCVQCYPDRNSNVVINGEEKCVNDLYNRVLKKKLYYAHRGYTLHELWEHELDKNDAYIKSRLIFYQTIKVVGPIDIRESFYGGRTNNIKFYHKCSDNEVIRYLDFTSLYPFVLRQFDYPLGHPKLIQEDFKTVDDYFGFIKCKVIPPLKLNIGVLPMRISKKLIFPLCFKCANDSVQTSCSHSELERAMISTWTSIELQEAVKYGYKIVKIYQVLDYKVNKGPSIFANYVKMWLKTKQESSDWPSWVQNQEDRDKYILDYKNAEGIELDSNAIEKNPGRRSIAKLMLNSFWGKLAQTTNLPQTEFIRNYADLWSIINNEEKEILGIHEASEKIMMVQHRYCKDSQEKILPGKTNIAVASFVTAYARRELFRLIQKIEAVREGRVLYFDTDSVVFVEKDGDPLIQCGDYLGQLTDEIDPGWKCNLFVTLGPKNYAYQVVNASGQTKSNIKVKGIKLSSGALDIITVQRLVQMAEQYIHGNQDQFKVAQTNIVSNKFTHQVTTRNFDKIYRAVSEKRRIIGNNTRPYGYVD